MKLFPENPVLLVDDEEPWLHSFALALRQHGGISHVIKCTDSREVTSILGTVTVAAVVMDLTMPHISGDQLLKKIVTDYPGLPVIILTGMNQIEMAVGCMKLGAFDFYVKTAERERLVAGVQRAIEFNALKQENIRLREQMLASRSTWNEAFSSIITDSDKMAGMFRYLEAIAPSDQPVLIMGESGTGKELCAHAVHQLSRPDMPLVAVNAAGLDDDLFADTLFGHIRGAFTGADGTRRGMLEEADGGTLFLDEIGDLSAASQIKLLRLIQEGEYYPVGSDRPRKSRARLVCATNVDLEKKRDQGLFRSDLYYRLYTHQVVVPPLRERLDDLPMLVNFFLDQSADELGKPRPTMPVELIGLLRSYHFPGNVRELRAMVVDAVSLHQRGKLALGSFRAKISPDAAQSSDCSLAVTGSFDFPSQLPTLADMAVLLVGEAMERAQGNQRTAAAMLGISQQALSKRLKKINQS